MLLPDLDGGELRAGAYAIAKEGSIIAGYGTELRGQEAAIWVRAEVMALEDVVLAQGGELPAGFTLQEVRALSDDGRVLVGNGLNGDGFPEGFRITLAHAP
jgi:uncharacterized membrane protein